MIQQLKRCQSLLVDGLDSAKAVAEQAIRHGDENDLLDVVRLRVMARELVLELEKAEHAVLERAKQDAAAHSCFDEDDYTRPLGSAPLLSLSRGGMTA